MLKPTDLTDLETALMRADWHMTSAEGNAPAGVCTHAVQLARAELQRAQTIVGRAGQNTQNTQNNQDTKA